MTCYHPIGGFKGSDGKLNVRWNPDCGINPYIEVPCGSCIGCRLDQSRSWSIRCVHEAQMHNQNMFLTLTYSDDYLPAMGDLRIKHFQDFMKRLRKRFEDIPIRFFHCGEYGTLNKRPHYHALIFGLDMPDKILYQENRGNKIYRSPLLETLWPLGFSTIGSVTWQSAGYVARYVMKKITGDMAKAHYERLDEETGEIYNLKPEYTTMSRRPGIGYDWYQKYKSDVFPHDYVVIEGKQFKPPIYYDRLLERDDPELHAEIKLRREKFAQTNIQDSTPSRLAVREYCKSAQTRLLKRDL